MILVRHGQSYFNLHYGTTRIDPGIRDPALTELGRAQAASAAEALKVRGIKRLLVSPYTRTLETAQIIADILGIPVTVEPLVRERAAFTCDIGTSRGELSRLWPHLSFAHLEEPWWHAGEESEAALRLRCERFRTAMAALADWRAVGVVSHWGFIRALTGQAIANGTHVDFDPTAELVK
ncbi:MAG TPA: histidine phosphatase family protein [Alphaproteobacteria bacterium]|nr:histidine phosphatase family protein [Alphaproteobacteria bacterium]